MKIAKLRLISGEVNSNKFYYMFASECGSRFDVEYGREGATAQKTSYPMSKWDATYKSKTKKGYVDYTELFIIEDSTSTKIVKEVKEFLESRTKEVINIVKKLQSWAKGSIAENYSVSSEAVTQKQIDKAQELLTQISTFDLTQNNTQDLNKLLLTFYGIIPRKMKNVNLHLLKESELQKNIEKLNTIIIEEQATLDVMAGQVLLAHNMEESENTENEIVIESDIISNSGLEIKAVTDTKIIDKIKSMMADNKNKFKEAFEVINIKSESAYNNNLKIADNKKEELFWHGSRNENWWSILTSSLVIRPSNAVHSGSLLGDAIYFAPLFKKSYGYTSGRNSYWAKGNSNEAVLALYSVHVGNKFEMRNKAYAIYDPKKELYDKGYNSVHCYAGASMGYSKLINDEITIYKPEQCTIKYLIIVQA